MLEPWIRPLRPGLRVAGLASTVELAADDNLFMRRAIEAGPGPGPLLVVAGAERSRAAVMGGNVAAELAARGFGAVIADGPVRDAAEILELGLPVWSRGTTPVRPGKHGPGSLGQAVFCAGVLVRPGDLVAADDDGIVVWPRERLQELLAAARKLSLRQG